MNSIQSQFKKNPTTLGLALISSLGAIAFSTPAYSINVDLSTFDAIGDVTNNNTVIQSGTDNTVDADALETFLAFTPGSLDVDTTFGSAIKQTLNFNAGDRFSFDWTFNIDSQDQAFVAINNAIQVLSTGSSYSYTFATAGNYQVAMGVVDFFDSTGSSTLTLSNAQIQPVPWETDALPVVGTTLLFGIGIWKKHKSSNSNNRDLK
ncbi:MAG: PEP-CTERM sorting domain-containing protein [Snowella sp.]|nr:MAG: PEP-CTERM sorting domain-containing protein [Snowella sp.]